VQFRSGAPHFAANVVPGGKAVRAQFARHGKQVGKLWPHVAADAGDGRATRQVIVGKTLDDFLAELAFMIEHIVGYAQPVGHGARIADIVAGAAGPLAARRRAVIVKLQRHANGFRAAAGGQGGDYRTVHPARHGHDDALSSQWTGQLEQRAEIKGIGGKGGFGGHGGGPYTAARSMAKKT